MPTSFCTIAFFPTSVGTVFPSSADLGVGKNRLKVPTPAHPVTALYFPCIPALYQALALYFAPQQFVQLRAQLETAVSVSIIHSANRSRPNRQRSAFRNFFRLEISHLNFENIPNHPSRCKTVCSS